MASLIMNAFFTIIFIPLAIIALILHVRFLKILRRSHPDVWRSLGSPSVLNNTMGNGLATLKYLLRGEFRRLDDREFVRLCETLRLFDMIYLIGFGIWASFVFVWSIYEGTHAG